MIPSWPISVTEACEHIKPAFPQYSVNTKNEFGSVFNLDMVEATHVINKGELVVCKGQVNETCIDKA